MTNTQPPLPSHLHGTLKAHSGPVHVARLNSFGRYLLTGGADRQIHLFNVSSSSLSSVGSSPIKTYNAHNGTVQALDISPDNARFLCGGQDRNVHLYDVGKGTVLRRFSAHHGAINTLAFAGEQSASLVAAAGFDTTLRFYDLRAQGAWKPIMECKEAKDAILCMAIREADVWTGSVDGVVRTYDLRKGELREDTFDRPITSVMPSTTQTTLLVSCLAREGDSSKQATHSLLDLTDGTHLQSIQGGPNVQYRCRSTLWSSDSTIIAGDESGCIRAWDIVSGQERRVAGGSNVQDAVKQQQQQQQQHTKATLWIEGTDKEGGKLVSAGADGVVKIWGVQPSPTSS